MPYRFVLTYLSLFGFENITSYFIGELDYPWAKAIAYCATHCNSTLLSVHSNTTNNELKQICTILSSTGETDCWIGLTDAANADTWLWSDGTTLDFGSDTSELPWADGEPNGNGNCIQLQAAASPAYAWDDLSCINSNHFFCNDCGLTLTKYILKDFSLSQTNANQYCSYTFGTELATIQSENDFQEAKYLCDYTYAKNCWIGLNYNTSNTNGSWEWEDGTQNLDFWTNSSGDISGYPWADGQPSNYGNSGQNCVRLYSSEFNAYNTLCTNTNKFLCNSAIHNYICYANVQRDIWSDLSCNWEWKNTKSDGCGVTVNDVEEECTTWLGDDSGTTAFLSWEDMVMEVTFAFTDMTYFGSKAGVIIRAENASPTNNSGEHYFVALDLNTNTIDLIEIDNNDWYILSKANLSFSANIGIYYNIRCELIGNEFKIYVDNVLYITYSDSSFTHGSVGLRTWKQTAIYKKLFISGLEYDPTQAPTVEPTIEPSYEPTYDPSENPSAIPTEIATNDPTSETSDPTIEPNDPIVDTANKIYDDSEDDALFIVVLVISIVIVLLVIVGIFYYFLFYKKKQFHFRNEKIQVNKQNQPPAIHAYHDSEEDDSKQITIQNTSVAGKYSSNIEMISSNNTSTIGNTVGHDGNDDIDIVSGGKTSAIVAVDESDGSSLGDDEDDNLAYRAFDENGNGAEDILLFGGENGQ